MEKSRENGNLHKRSVSGCGSSVAVRRSITVHASSEALCLPDVFSLAVSISSVKDAPEAAQSSVKRRSEYILQVFRNSGIKEKRVERSTHVSRRGEDEVSVRMELLAKADSLQACETARNVIVTKMDSTVECGEVEPHISPNHRAETRRLVFQQAVMNAREKAASVARLLEVRLGPALEVEETSNTDHIIRGASPDNSVDQSTTPDRPPVPLTSHREGERDCYSATVRVAFEVSPLRTCLHRSCHKHRYT